MRASRAEWPAGPSAAGPANRDRPMAAERRAAMRRRWALLLKALLIMLPSLLALAYYGAIAADRYVSEARFVIRTAAKPAGNIGGLNALLQLVGMARSQDDTFVVHDYLTSRDALAALAGSIDLAGVYGAPQADALARWPSLIYGRTDEDRFRYFETMISVVANGSSGVTTLRVQAFRPDDVWRIARTLLDLAEALVNRLNERVQRDALRVADAEVAAAERRRIDDEIAMTNFRNRELMLDPSSSSAIVVELVGKLSGELAETQAQLAEMQAGTRNNPQIASLAQRAAALAHQIATERARIGSNADGLAEKIAEYQRLAMQQQFSVRALAQAVAAQDIARTDAMRQQLFLERVVEPNRPDKATEPRRLRTILTVLGLNLVGFAVLWLIWAGLREHTQA